MLTMPQSRIFGGAAGFALALCADGGGSIGLAIVNAESEHPAAAIMIAAARVLTFSAPPSVLLFDLVRFIRISPITNCESLSDAVVRFADIFDLPLRSGSRRRNPMRGR
ncbi:MAG TPA: hypothetical protein VMV13_04410 [Candidatus Binataceae bacterium]|nr:hypothetical protein [Candidatus Binataceae bacterium]